MHIYNSPTPLIDVVPTPLADVAVGQIPGTRPRQEDSACACPLKRRDGSEPYLLLVLADGMGGYDDGDKASKCAVEAFCNAMERYVKEGIYFRGNDGEDGKVMLCEAIKEANDRLIREKKGRRLADKAGCTFLACLISEDAQNPGTWASFLSIGDSLMYAPPSDRDKNPWPIYLVNKLHNLETQLQRDYDDLKKKKKTSLTKELYFKQWISEHGRSRLRALTSALKGSPDFYTHFDGHFPNPDYVDTPRSRRLRPGDHIILTSDGVLAYGGADELEGLLKRYPQADSRWLAEFILGNIKSKIKKGVLARQDNSSIVWCRYGRQPQTNGSLPPALPDGDWDGGEEISVRSNPFWWRLILPISFFLSLGGLIYPAWIIFQEKPLAPKQGEEQQEKQAPKQGEEQQEKQAPKQGGEQQEKQAPKQGEEQQEKQAPKQGEEQQEKQAPKQGGEQQEKQAPKQGEEAALKKTIAELNELLHSMLDGEEISDKSASQWLKKVGELDKILRDNNSNLDPNLWDVFAKMIDVDKAQKVSPIDFPDLKLEEFENLMLKEDNYNKSIIKTLLYGTDKARADSLKAIQIMRAIFLGRSDIEELLGKYNDPSNELTKMEQIALWCEFANLTLAMQKLRLADYQDEKNVYMCRLDNIRLLGSPREGQNSSQHKSCQKLFEYSSKKNVEKKYILAVQPWRLFGMFEEAVNPMGCKEKKKCDDTQCLDVILEYYNKQETENRK